MERDGRGALVFLALAGIVVLGAWLRAWRLGEFPPGIHVDEASIGYNAYCIAMTGRDERGESTPLYCRAWSADHEYAKYPVFMYSAVAAIRWFGPTIQVLRGVSVTYGLITIVLTAFVGQRAFGWRVGLLSALLLAVQPMHQSHSRSGVEVITFPCFLAAGALLLLVAVKHKRYWPAAALCLAFTFYCYGVARMFVPVLVMGFVAVNYRITRAHWWWILVGAGIALLALVPDIQFLLTGRGTEHFKLISVFGEAGAARGRQILASVGWEVLAQSRIAASLATAVVSYFHFLSPVFLCINGGDSVKCGVTKMGLLHMFEVPTLILGVAMLLKHWRRPANNLFLLWLLLYPVADSLTYPPSIARMASSLPALSIVSALGLERIFVACFRLDGFIRGRRRRVSVALAAAIVSLMACEVWHYYRVYFGDHFTSVFFQWHRHDLDALQFARAHEQEYDEIVFVDYFDYYTYVVLLFALKADPHEWQAHKTAGKFAIVHYDGTGRDVSVRGRTMTVAYPNHIRRGRRLRYIMDPTGTVPMLEIREFRGSGRLRLRSLAEWQSRQ